MKQATGELVTSVSVLVAVGVLIAFFYYGMWPVIKSYFVNNTNCNKAICEPCLDSSGKASTNCKYVTCHSQNDKSKEFQCVFKG